MTSNRSRLVTAVAVITMLVSALIVTSPSAHAQEPEGPAKCKGGRAAGQFFCKNIDLAGYVPAGVMGGAGIADVWGWVDPDSKKEYAILGSTEGVQFLDVTKPAEPIYLGVMPIKAPSLIWHEIEILNDHAYIVCDLDPCGLQIFDLKRLAGVESALPVWRPDAVYPLGSFHTIDANPETNHIFLNGLGAVVGSPTGTPLIFDVSQPLVPVPVGIIADDGYTHDSECVNYKGPDKSYKGNEICFNFNEDTVTIYDVTSNPTRPVQLARETYENASYTHSGALTKDHTTLISTDEGDEQSHGILSTVYIWDITKLTKPKLIGTFTHDSGAIDHNLYSEADALYHANYVNGFRILDLKNAHKGKLKEVAYFDTVPMSDAPEFNGVWAAYPYLPSGNILVGHMDGGLFIVRPEAKVFKSLGVKRK